MHELAGRLCVPDLPAFSTAENPFAAAERDRKMIAAPVVFIYLFSKVGQFTAAATLTVKIFNHLILHLKKPHFSLRRFSIKCRYFLLFFCEFFVNYMEFLNICRHLNRCIRLDSQKFSHNPFCRNTRNRDISSLYCSHHQ